MAGIDWKTLFVTLNGRIGPRAYWAGFAAVMAVALLLPFLGTWGMAPALALLWPLAAIHAKRLHDAGRSAWWILAPLVAGACGLAAGGLNHVADGATGLASKALLLASLGVGGAFVLWVGQSPGEAGPNEYGAPG